MEKEKPRGHVKPNYFKEFETARKLLTNSMTIYKI